MKISTLLLLAAVLFALRVNAQTIPPAKTIKPHIYALPPGFARGTQNARLAAAAPGNKVNAAPVTAAATADAGCIAGSNSQLPIVKSFLKNYLLGVKYTVPFSGPLKSLSLYGNGTGAGVQMALYKADNNVGGPAALVAASAHGIVTTGPVNLPVPGGINITAGDYWIMAIYDNDGYHTGRDETNAKPVYYSQLSFGSEIPASGAGFVSYTGDDINYWMVVDCSGNAPSIASFAPAIATSGASVTITGSGFVGVTSVSFGGVPASSFKVVSNSTIVATLAAGGASGFVTVAKNAGQQLASLAGFTFIPPQPPGNTLVFNGVNNKVAVNTGTATIKGSFTAEAWVRPADAAGTIAVLSTRDGADYGFDMTLTNGHTIHGDIGDGNGWLTTAADAEMPYKAGIWCHIAYVVTPAGYTIYANGVVVGKGSFAGSPLLVDQQHQLTIGADGSYGEFFNGSIDEARLYSTALTPANIQADMHSTAIAVPGALQLYYNFDQPTGNVLTDQSSNQYPGTVQGDGPYNFTESYAMVVPVFTHATFFAINGATCNFYIYWTAPSTGIAESYLADEAYNPGFNPIEESNYHFDSPNGDYVNATLNGIFYLRVRADKASVAGQGAYSNTLAVSTYIPTITSFSPVSSPKGGTVTITGQGLSNVTAVSFGGVAAASFKIIDDNTIAAVAGAGASGDVSVTSFLGTGTKSGFTFLECAPVSTGVSITADGGPAICSGLGVTFTAKPVNGGTPVYQWYHNSTAVGSNSNKYKDTKIADGDNIYCVMTSSAKCVINNPVTSNALTFSVTPRQIPAITVTSDGGTTLCKGTVITLTATAANVGANPAYQWKKNGVIVSTSSNTYTDGALKSNDQVTCAVIATAACVLPASATSKPMVFKVNPILTPVVTITPNITGMVCAGTHLIFTATVVNGGKATYKWYKNGVAAGGNSSATYAQNQLTDGDSVWCVITSAGACLASPTTKSNVYKYVVFSKNPPVLTITSNADAGVCPGGSVTFMATTTDTITNPQYVWTVNGAAAGGNTNTFVDATPVNGDAIICTMTKQLPCVAGTAVSTASATLNFTAVALPAQPSAISGPGSVTKGQAGITFTVTKTSGLTYNWVVPADASITSGQGIYRITANWGSTAGTVSVTTANRCGNSPASIKKVAVATSLRLDANEPAAASLAGNILRLYPSPVTSTATVEFTAETVNKYEAQVINQLGQLVTSKAGMTVKGLNTVKFEMGNLASAVYYVRLIDTEHGTRVLKLVKAK